MRTVINGHSTESTFTKSSTLQIEVPLREVDTAESISLGFRQLMFDLRDDDGKGGQVSTGAGLGTDVIILEWGDKSAFVRGIDLLRMWVATFDPEAAKQFPEL